VAVLSRGQIYERLSRKITDGSCLAISPLLQAETAFDSDSVDLRLGTHFLLPRVPPQPYTYPGSTSSKAGHQPVHIPLGEYLVVPAHQTVLGMTLEFITLPGDLSGQILTKSSVARTFVVIETAPWIHPEYRGCLTLEIANVSNTPLLLYPGRLVAQLILFEVPGGKAAKKYGGTYLGPVYPEPPTFLDPQDDLAKIGVRAVGIPGAKRDLISRNFRCPECLAKLSSRRSPCAVCRAVARSVAVAARA
jgi:dCTP deaminase